SDQIEEAAKSLAPFDRVLVDVPCSNTGVLARRAEARWRFRVQDVQELSLQQLALLKQAARRGKGGGIVVYSTCSLEAEENERVVDALLDARPEFRLVEKNLTLPDCGETFAGWRDGGFWAKLERKS